MTECSQRSQKGFTLLELMVAMAIFAMLAVAGWQVFDSITRTKDRAEQHLEVLTELQYGYAQIQRDMMQAVPYQIPPIIDNDASPATDDQASQADQSSQAKSGGADNSSNTTKPEPIAEPYFRLQQNQLSFVRRADPDPRYAQSAQLERIVYRFNEEALVRERFTSLSMESNERPLESVLIKGIKAGQIQVLLPEPASVFPSPNQNNSAPTNPSQNRKAPSSLGSQANSQQANGASGFELEGPDLLPKGVEIKFTARLGNLDTPINWVFALSKVPPKPTIEYSKSSNEESKKGDTSENGAGQNGAGQNGNSGQISSTENNNSAQNKTNTPPTQSMAP